MQATLARDRLSRTAKKSVTVDMTTGAFVILTNLRSLADILQSSMDSSIAIWTSVALRNAMDS
jgi:hypothetical protein